MSAQVFTLEQVCKEDTSPKKPPECGIYQRASTRERTVPPNRDTTYKLYEVLRHLVTMLALPQPLDEMLQTLATLTMQAMEIDLCVILLREQVGEHLRVSTCAPDLSDKGVVMRPVQVTPTSWQRLHSCMLDGQLSHLSIQELEALNPLQNVQYETLLPVPLIAGSEQIGLLHCYSSKALSYTSDDALVLNTIANQAALAIKHRQCIKEEVLAQKSLIRTFVSDLCAGNAVGKEALKQRAYLLGYDLARSHAVAMIELADSNSDNGHECVMSMKERLVLYEGVLGQMKRALQRRYPGSLIDDRANSLTCLLYLNDNSSIELLNAWINDLVRQIRHEHHVQVFSGIGNLCQAEDDYRRGYAEAHEALEVGRNLNLEGCSNHFNALGAYRYLYKFAHTDTLRDQYQEQIATIVEYDRRKKTNLLDTLEIYLECGGNVAKTSSYLDVHRNTLLQRLDRLQKLCALDLERLRNRFPLLAALKVHRLRTHGGSVE